MSHEFPDRPPIYHDAWRVAIVASEYNSTYVDGLVKFASDELSLLLPESNFATLRVPGSFEIPLGTKVAIETLNVHAVLAFGLLFDGETLHAELIAGAVTKALLDLSLAHRVPVLHEVLVCKTQDQAKERCLMPVINRGTEAARAAVRMLAALRSLRAV
jgi:6,7-dimethyl-8-ribityllumazine synthase